MINFIYKSGVHHVSDGRVRFLASVAVVGLKKHIQACFHLALDKYVLDT